MLRQCKFLTHLYLTGSVRSAVPAAAMSRHSAYRLRKRAGVEGFACAWDAVLMPPGAGQVWVAVLAVLDLHRAIQPERGSARMCFVNLRCAQHL